MLGQDEEATSPSLRTRELLPFEGELGPLLLATAHTACEKLEYGQWTSPPAQAYGKLLRHLQQSFEDVGFLDRVGHNPRYLVTDGW